MAKKWIQEAINPAHKGYCTPMTKSTCTPRRKALAKRFKSGDLSKKQMGGVGYDDIPEYQTAGHVFMPTGTYDTSGTETFNTAFQKSLAQENPVPTTDKFMQTDRGKKIIDKYKSMGYDVTPDATTGQLKFRKGAGDWQDNPYTETFNKAASFATGVGNLFQEGRQRNEERHQLNQSMTPKYFQNMEAQGLNNVPAYMEYGGDIVQSRDTYYGSGMHGEGMSYPVKQVSSGQNRDIYSQGVVQPTDRTYEEVPQPTYNKFSGTGRAIKPHYGPGYMFGGHDNTFNRQPVMEYGGWDQEGFMFAYGGSPDYMMYGGMGEGLPADPRDMTNVEYGYQGIRSNNPYGHMSMYQNGGDVPAGYHRMPDGSIMSDVEMMKTGGVTSDKAKEILRDGTVHGKALTEKQKRYFGWIAGGSKPRKEYGGWKQEGFMLQTGGDAFTQQEQQLADQYRKQGYDVSKSGGKLNFKKIGAPASGGAVTPPQQQLQSKVDQSIPDQQIQAAGPQQAARQPKTFDAKAIKDLKSKYKSNPYLVAADDNKSNNRYFWATQTDREFPLTGGTVRDAVTEAAQLNGIDPSLLYSSAMEEGMSGAIDDKKWEMASTYYNNWADKNPKKKDEYPVDGFYNYGLDQFPGVAKTLENKGYLPKGFSNQYTTFGAKNEKKENITTAAFKTDADALKAKSAMMRLAKDQLGDYAKKQGIDLTPEQQQFFMLANYNGGEGNMQKMLKSYKDKGYLKNNKFLTDTSFKPEAYGGIYKNVMRRIQAANMMKNEGVFEHGGHTGYMEYGGECDDCGKTVKFKNGGVANYSHDSRKLPYYHAGGDINHEALEEYNMEEFQNGGKWIQKAIKHPGRCSNPGDERCPKGSPQYNLAMRFKHGDLHKKQMGGYGVGDEVELTPEQIKQLRKAGYQIEEI